MKEKLDAIIVGGGISGLTTAYLLFRQGMKIRLLEKKDRVGGAIQTVRQEGFLVESGPNSSLETAPVLKTLFEELGILKEMEYANPRANIRYIVRNGELIPLPMNPIAFLKTPLFSIRAKLRLLKEPFIKAADSEIEETLAQFVERRLGREFLDYAIDPFVAGVYAGKPEALSVRSAFPKLFELEQKYGSLIKGAVLGARERKKRAETSKQSARLFSFKQGLQTLVNALERQLGNTIFKSFRISAIEKNGIQYTVQGTADGEEVTLTAPLLIFAVPAYVLAEFPWQWDFPPAESLKSIFYPPVSMVFFGYFKNAVTRPLDGFGFLIPRNEHRNILGTIWSSTIFSNRAPEGGIALTTFVGGSRQPENALLPDDKLIEMVRKDLQDLIGLRGKPDFVKIVKWEKAIPQYNIGHMQIIQQLSDFEQRNPGLFITGNFRGGISVSDCIKNSYELSKRIKDQFSEIKKDVKEIPTMES